MAQDDPAKKLEFVRQTTCLQLALQTINSTDCHPKQPPQKKRLLITSALPAQMTC